MSNIGITATISSADPVVPPEMTVFLPIEEPFIRQVVTGYYRLLWRTYHISTMSGQVNIRRLSLINDSKHAMSISIDVAGERLSYLVKPFGYFVSEVQGEMLAKHCCEKRSA